MRNQLRAALYLISRDAYAKGAVVMVALAVLRWLPMALFSKNLTVSFELLLNWGLNATVFFSCFAALGLASHDRRDRGYRSACLAERGRVRHALASALALGILVAALTLLAVALALLSCALPRVTFDGTPPGELVALVVEWALVAWVFAALGGLIGTGVRGMGSNLVVALLLTGGGIRVLVQMAVLLASYAAYAITGTVVIDLAEALAAIDALMLRPLLQGFAVTDYLSAFALPAVYLVLITLEGIRRARARDL